MTVDLQIKKGDTKVWRFVLSDATGSAMDLTGTVVYFRMRWHEGHATNYFDRRTGAGGTSNDYITISDATNGVMTIKPTASDWSYMSDNYGVYVGEFRVTSSDGASEQYLQDFEVDIQRGMV